MAEEEETREVLFPDWEGPDKTGLTIEQTSEGEIFVKEVKGESPAARSGKVYEGDQIVGATVYFDNMSSEETAELLKTLNRHKVGLKLQNKGDKSPYCSPLSTPCRSPMGTLTWEGTTRFGGSSPDIILSGEDEDYKRIYTKKIKPRLKSEDLAEGVDVRTERHSSTSSDGSTITTITRRITTYTVDMPGGISEKLELSSPEFKGLRHESGDGSPRIRISHGLSGKVEAEEGVFESSNVSYTGPQVSSTETHRGSGVIQTTTERVTGSRHITIGGMGGAELTSADENGGSISLALPGRSMHFVTSSTDRTQEGRVDTSVGGKTKVKISESTITHPQAKVSGNDNTVLRFGGSRVIDTELTGGGIGGSAITIGNVSSGYSSVPSKISVAGMDVNLTDSKLKDEVDVNLPSTQIGIKAFGIDREVSGIKSESAGPKVHLKATEVDTEAAGVDVGGSDVNIKGLKIKTSFKTGPTLPAHDIGLKGSKVKGDVDLSVPKTEGHTTMPEFEIKGPEVNIERHGQLHGPKVKLPKISGPKISLPDIDVKVKEPKLKGDLKGDVELPKAEFEGPDVTIDVPEIGSKKTKFKMPKFGFKGPKDRQYPCQKWISM
ncbi:Neuroblast differentiation-associated protein AHNAK [Larimichthys crocea]|uniref:Uncharacterized protein n=1 Tax=Larimichthys crocea TaxID=215358 RepID=A0ACD3RD45_LARCR|nr:Neuroblast differentiation-associated protein AHNAK [Larimichthys crocea]